MGEALETLGEKHIDGVIRIMYGATLLFILITGALVWSMGGM
jgi:hypothetical protein